MGFLNEKLKYRIHLIFSIIANASKDVWREIHLLIKDTFPGGILNISGDFFLNDDKHIGLVSLKKD